MLRADLILYASFMLCLVYMVGSQSLRCKLGKKASECHKGKTGAPADRYYYNERKMTCLAFRANGCHNNETSFASKSACELECMPADGPTCSGGVAFGVGGRSLVDCESGGAEGPDARRGSCPPGGICVFGWAFSACCNKTVEDEYMAAFETTCEDGVPAYTLSNGEWEETVVGDSCDDLVCPSSFKCVNIGRRFAKCCRNGRKVIPLPTDPPVTSTRASPKFASSPTTSSSRSASTTKGTTPSTMGPSSSRPSATTSLLPTDRPAAIPKSQLLIPIKSTTTEAPTQLPKLPPHKAAKPSSIAFKQGDSGLTRFEKASRTELVTVWQGLLVPENPTAEQRRAIHGLNNPVLPLRPGPCFTNPAYAANCSTWANQGSCITNPRFMNVHCQEACNCCGCTVGDVINAPFADKCEDRKERCREWASPINCVVAKSFFESYCRASCRIC